MNIISNGSKWLGQAPDSVEDLLSVLAIEPLNPVFESYGNFVLSDEMPVGTVRCWGNFANVSHVFQIEGTEAEMRPVIDAIRANQDTEAYAAARKGMKLPKKDGVR
jgi:hypothetical protein